MSKSQNKNQKKDQPKALSAAQVKEITDYIRLRKDAGADDVVIRKEVFKKFQIDTTQWELKWGESAKTVKGSNKNTRVAGDKSMQTTNNTNRRHEPVSFKHEYSQEEISERAHILAQLEIDRNALEEEKKNISSDFKTKIDEKETAIGKIAREINSGFEMRNETCEVIRHFNENSKKAYFKGVLVKEEKLSPSDFALQMEFPEPAEA